MATVQNPVWPGPNAVTVAMYPENQLAALTARVRKAVSGVEGINLRPAGERAWPHSTLAYFRAGDVHDAACNRRLRSIHPDRVEITINRVHAVYMHQDPDCRHYTWDHLGRSLWEANGRSRFASGSTSWHPSRQGRRRAVA
ncbi:hypothetical protein [Streptomyces sp. Inha503]|uniref:hypothetical protein n=1 Tax=Streptomyces sp. Inha503 TaxID=3383314 RepID=UPI0039A2F604